jgi:adenylate kinase
LPLIQIKQTVEFARVQPGEFGEEIVKTLEAIKAKMVEEEQKLFDEAKKKKKAKKGDPVEEFNPDKCIPKLSDNFLVRIYKWRLSQPDCQNKGYVLDGWPKTYEQANLLFAPEGKVESFIPNSCFLIESTEEEIKDRLKKLPAEETQGTHWNE